MHGGSAVHAQMAQSMKPEIRIIGHQWWWEIHYLNDDPSQEFTTANELHLPAAPGEYRGGDARCDALVLDSGAARQGGPDSRPDELHSHRSVRTRRIHRPCAEFCGAEHARMRLLRSCEDEDSYEAWLQHSCSMGRADRSAASDRRTGISHRALLDVPHGARHHRRRHGRAGPDAYRQPPVHCGAILTRTTTRISKPGSRTRNL